MEGDNMGGRIGGQNTTVKYIADNVHPRPPSECYCWSIHLDLGLKNQYNHNQKKKASLAHCRYTSCPYPCAGTQQNVNKENIVRLHSSCGADTSGHQHHTPRVKSKNGVSTAQGACAQLNSTGDIFFLAKPTHLSSYFSFLGVPVSTCEL